MRSKSLAAAAIAFGVAALGLGVATAQTPPAPVDDALMATLMADGQALYGSTCRSCHGAQGEGGNGPELAGYSLLANAQTVINQTINGGGYMPPFGYLDNHSIAAVSTYIRNAWGNAFGPVTEGEVAALR